MILSKEKRSFRAKFISAPDKYLFSLMERDGIAKPIEQALWIWPEFVSRGHMRRAFYLDTIPDTAKLNFICDNNFDLFINGISFSGEKYGEMFSIDGIDAKKLLVKGENYIALRLFGTSSLFKQVSAICGGIELGYEDKNEYVLTDGSWECLGACNFYKKSEPDGWQTGAPAFSERNYLTFSLHPRYKTRSVYLKKEFYSAKSIKRATLYATAEGLYEPKLNGNLIDDAMFIPGSMEGVKEYQIFDVSDFIKKGNNTLSFTLASGWLNSCSWGTFYGKKPSIMAELELEYSDGEVEILSTDESFLLTASPLIDNDIQYGEKYDARLEEALLREENYVHSEVVEKEFDFLAQSYAPVRIKSEICPSEISVLSGGAYLFDYKTNEAGRAKITLKNTKPGQVIKIRYAELLDENGNPEIGVYQDVFFPDDNNPGEKAEYSIRNIDVYICRGDSEEVYYPRFAFTGFRYIYIEGYDGEITAQTVKKLVMHTDLAEVGDIETSDGDLELMWDVVKRSYRSNIFTGPTDCPTREKNFWNGDIQTFAHTAMWYMDNKEFLSRWTKYGRKIQYDVYGWEDEEYILPLTLYKFYGDISVIRDKYPVVKKLIEKREEQNGDNIFPDGMYAPYRDHKACDNVPADYYAAAYHTYSYRCACEMAEILGEAEDAKSHIAKFYLLRDKFNALYYIKEEKDYTPRCQGGVVFPLAFGLAPEEDRALIAKTLLRYVEKADYHFTTGFMSSERILGLLCDFGYQDAAYKIIKSRTYPSILDMIGSGATTTTENWTGLREIFKYDSMNHYSFGGFSRWFFEYLGGIKIMARGCEKINLEPTLIKDIKSFKVKYKTPFGNIESGWEYNENRDAFEYSCKVPEKIDCSLVFPDGKTVKINRFYSCEI